MGTKKNKPAKRIERVALTDSGVRKIIERAEKDGINLIPSAICRFARSKGKALSRKRVAKLMSV